MSHEANTDDLVRITPDMFRAYAIPLIGEDSFATDYTPQRGDVDGDCSIACISTLLGWDYETAAERMGYPTGPDGIAKGIDIGAIGVFEISARLLEFGIALTPLPIRERPGPYVEGHARMLVTPADLGALLVGRMALVQTTRNLDNKIEPIAHSIAWRGDEAVDCRTGLRLPWGSFYTYGAIIVSRIQPWGAQ